MRGLRTLPNELLARCPGVLPASPGLGFPSIGDLRQRSPKALPTLKFSCSKNVRGLPVRKPTHLRRHPPPISFTEQTGLPVPPPQPHVPFFPSAWTRPLNHPRGPPSAAQGLRSLKIPSPLVAVPPSFCGQVPHSQMLSLSHS